MPKINLDRTVHAGGKVFFKGEAVVSDQDKELIDAELERLRQIEAESEGEGDEAPKKGKAKTEK